MPAAMQLGPRMRLMPKGYRVNVPAPRCLKRPAPASGLLGTCLYSARISL